MHLVFVQEFSQEISGARKFPVHRPEISEPNSFFAKSGLKLRSDSKSFLAGNPPGDFRRSEISEPQSGDLRVSEEFRPSQEAQPVLIQFLAQPEIAPEISGVRRSPVLNPEISGLAAVQRADFEEGYKYPSTYLQLPKLPDFLSPPLVLKLVSPGSLNPATQIR